MRLVFLYLLFCLPAPASGGAPPSLTMENPRSAPRTTVVQYEEAWRAGDDPGEEFIFGVIIDAVADRQGNLYLLDLQQQQVFKFSPEGRYLGLVSRRGQGPGEIENVFSMCLPAPDRIGLLQGFPGRLIQVDRDGLPLPGLDFTLQSDDNLDRAHGFFFLLELHCRDGHMVGQGSMMLGNGQVQDNLNFVCSFGPDGKERVRYTQWRDGYDFTRAITVDEEKAFQPLGLWGLGPGGRVFRCISRDRYEIEVLDPDGKRELLIQRAWELHQRTPEEKAAAKNTYSFSSDGTLPHISYRMADTDPAIDQMEIMGDELWVSSPDRQRDLPPGMARQVAVFDLEGHLLEERRFAFPHRPEVDRPLFLPDGRVLLLENFSSAMASHTAGRNVQVGDQKNPGAGEGDSAALRVVLLKPVNN